LKRNGGGRGRQKLDSLRTAPKPLIDFSIRIPPPKWVGAAERSRRCKHGLPSRSPPPVVWRKARLCSSELRRGSLRPPNYSGRRLVGRHGAAHLARAEAPLRFKRPLHRCNACNPEWPSARTATRRRSWTAAARSVKSWPAPVFASREMEVGSARCADRTPQRVVPTRNGRASG